MENTAKTREWWLAEVEGVVAELVEKQASPKEQAEMWGWIERTFGLSAAATAKGLFAEWERKPEPDGSFADEQATADDEPPLLSKASPFDSGKEFVRRHWIKEAGCITRYWHGDFWKWGGHCYVKLGSDDLSQEMWKFLYGARAGTKGDSQKFNPKPNDVENVIKALKAGLNLNVDPPCWLDGWDGAENLLVFRNGLVDIGTGELSPLSPRLWTHHALDFDYDPVAKCPFWHQWLNEVFPGDPETQECIEEQLGYGMTNDVKFHKAFLWIGRKGREGKGTLAHILEKLTASFAALSFNDWLKSEYSSEVLLGKKVGCFPDVRLKEGKWWGQSSYDKGGLDHASKELALKISGGDPVTIRRKWKSVAWEGVLPLKLYLLSNAIPVFNDTNLASRFIHIAFNVSFRGKGAIGCQRLLNLLGVIRKRMIP